MTKIEAALRRQANKMVGAVSTRAIALSVCAATFPAACINLTPDYLPPSGDQKSRVKVTIKLNTVNSKVVIHGPIVCDASQARLAATLTNMDAIGVKKKDAIFFVPSGAPVFISVPIQVGSGASSAGGGYEGKIIFTQPVVTFTPVAGEFYEIEFNQLSATVFSLESGEPNAARAREHPSHLDETCRVTSTNHGSDKMQFFLEKR